MDLSALCELCVYFHLYKLILSCHDQIFHTEEIFCNRRVTKGTTGKD